uniref:Ubiquitin-like domain-containing protein n=1 Tax=Leersia perrieri TaxID=77586 RepID=A0A0D9W0G5_9ORYZ
MRIMVRTLRGDRVSLDVDGATTTVAQVKHMVMSRERIPVAMQRLFFSGDHLDDDHLTLAHYGVHHDSLLFLSLRLAADHNNRLQNQPESVTTTTQENHHHLRVVHVARDDNDDEDGIVTKRRKPVTRRAIRKILSRLQVDDAWTSHRDAKFLDLLLRHTAGGGGGRNVGELTGEEWSAIGAELNAATGSSFAVEELQRRMGEFRREFEAAGRIKNHPLFSYDPRRRVVVASQADWKNYLLENPEAAAYEGRRSSHLSRLRAIFSGDGGGGEVKCRETKMRSCLRKLLRNFGLRFKL